MNEKTDWTALGLIFALVLVYVIMVGALVYLNTPKQSCTTESVK